MVSRLPDVHPALFRPAGREPIGRYVETRRVRRDAASGRTSRRTLFEFLRDLLTLAVTGELEK